VSEAPPSVLRSPVVDPPAGPDGVGEFCGFIDLVACVDDD
jgi:hypothetical protein